MNTDAHVTPERALVQLVFLSERNGSDAGFISAD